MRMNATTKAAGVGAIGVALSASIIVGCSDGPGIAPADTSPTALGVVSAQEEDAAAGARLWADNCMRCHNYRAPASLSDSQWSIAMRHMRVRANLTAEEHRLILQFLQAAN
jgi:mono/diheme cytochrome c family protein